MNDKFYNLQKAWEAYTAQANKQYSDQFDIYQYQEALMGLINAVKEYMKD